MLILQRPEISIEEVSENRSRFTIEPLEPGFGLTLGNTMRRALLSRVPGVAVTGLKIEGVNHEFTSIPGVFISTRIKVIPVCFIPESSVLTKTKIQSANCPSVVQVFCPLITYSSPSNSALHLSEAKSDPEPGSE